MNDIDNLCEVVGEDVDMVRKGIGSDNRIVNKFLYPGVEYGGSCFPKDVKALIHTSKSKGKRFRVLEAVKEVNDFQKEVLFQKLFKHFNHNIMGLKFTAWGLIQTGDRRYTRVSGTGDN